MYSWWDTDLPWHSGRGFARSMHETGYFGREYTSFRSRLQPIRIPNLNGSPSLSVAQPQRNMSES
jgi:hypothetical protein